MTAWVLVGMAVAALPLVLAVSWAAQRRMTARFVGCLVASLVGAAGLAALLGYVGGRLTYDPHETGPIGNWSGLSSATFAALVLASRERLEQQATG